jgi:hypothetical protein
MACYIDPQLSAPWPINRRTPLAPPPIDLARSESKATAHFFYKPSDVILSASSCLSKTTSIRFWICHSVRSQQSQQSRTRSPSRAQINYRSTAYTSSSTKALPAVSDGGCVQTVVFATVGLLLYRSQIYVTTFAASEFDPGQQKDIRPRTCFDIIVIDIVPCTLSTSRAARSRRIARGERW